MWLAHPGKQWGTPRGEGLLLEINLSLIKSYCWEFLKKIPHFFDWMLDFSSRQRRKNSFNAYHIKFKLQNMLAQAIHVTLSHYGWYMAPCVTSEIDGLHNNSCHYDKMRLPHDNPMIRIIIPKTFFIYFHNNIMLKLHQFVLLQDTLQCDAPAWLFKPPYQYMAGLCHPYDRHFLRSKIILRHFPNIFLLKIMP